MGIDELLKDLRILVVDVLDIMLAEITLLFHIGNLVIFNLCVINLSLLVS
jgi:hypothetical protein